MADSLAGFQPTTWRTLRCRVDRLPGSPAGVHPLRAKPAAVQMPSLLGGRPGGAYIWSVKSSATRRLTWVMAADRSVREDQGAAVPTFRGGGWLSIDGDRLR